jgi:hypothetical protein
MLNIITLKESHRLPSVSVWLVWFILYNYLAPLLVRFWIRHNKCKVFFWQLLNDRLSTRELLKQRNMVLNDYNCILCNLGTEESLVHLLLASPFCDCLLEHLRPHNSPAHWPVCHIGISQRSAASSIFHENPNHYVFMCWSICPIPMQGNLQERICSSYSSTKAKIWAIY